MVDYMGNVNYVLIRNDPHLLGARHYISKLDCTTNRTSVYAELGVYSKYVLVECVRVGKT